MNFLFSGGKVLSCGAKIQNNYQLAIDD
jgi:hypothetical protein